MAALTITAATTPVTTRWLEPLVSSSPRAASSSSGELCWRRLIATLSYSQLDTAEHRFCGALWRRGSSFVLGPAVPLWGGVMEIYKLQAPVKITRSAGDRSGPSGQFSALLFPFAIRPHRPQIQSILR